MYYAEDKDLQDVLTQASKRFSVGDLRKLLRERGMFFSSSLTKQQLITAVSRLPYGWTQLERLLKLVELPDRIERTSTRTLRCEYDKSRVTDAIKAVADARSARDESYSIESPQKNVIVVKVDYSELDVSKTRMAQRIKRTLTLRIEKSDEGLRIRHEAQPIAGEVIDELRKKLSEAISANVEADEISLEGVTAPLLRTQFFTSLINGIEGYRLEQVTNVGVHRAKSPSVAVDDPTDEPDNGDSDATPDAEIETDRAKFVAEVEAMALKGTNLANTDHYKDALDDNFYVSSIVWTVSPIASSHADAKKFQLEARFENAELAKDFVYRVRRVHDKKRLEATADFKKDSRAPTEPEAASMMKAMEASAHAAQAAIKKAIASEPTEPASDDAVKEGS